MIDSEFIFRKATQVDIPQITILQDKNLQTKLSEEEQEKNGYVTTQFTTELLTEIIETEFAFVACHQEQVIGYLFAASWTYFKQWPIFAYMMTKIDGLMLEGQRLSIEQTFQYGPICVDADYRGESRIKGGVIKPLFDLMVTNLSNHFTFALTFINQTNPRSIKAHTHKLGWTMIGDFTFNEQSYYICGYKLEERLKNN